MSLFRGFDTYMTSRVARAKGDHHYFDVATLRYFDAYGGASFSLPGSLDPERRFVVIVESVAHPTVGRVYRPTVVLFTPDAKRGGEHVAVFHPYDDDATTAPKSRTTATRRAERYARSVRASMADDGITLDGALEIHGATGF